MLNGLPGDPVRDVVEAIVVGGGQAEVYLGDVANEFEALDCAELASQRFGGLDIPVSTSAKHISTEKKRSVTK